MPEATFSDEWLVQSLEGLVDAERLAELRGKADPAKTLWETLVATKTCTDEQILGKLAARFRMKVADATQIDPKVREVVPETLARRYRILPLRMTDSYLEVATANPFDMHAEKDLAFATAREVRLLLLAPSQINLRLDELYRPDRAINKLLSGMESSADLVQLTEAPAEEIKITEEEASQRPVVRLVENHEGILLVTGTTGSGKTTTLYSAINQIKGEGVNIVTVEDPVEYRMAGIVQVQVQEKAGLTFAAALRSILRQDPNVVLVGEIRDRETAMIAVQASLTGHLVLSTLHTNDAANAVTRLVDIGVEPYKIAAALRGVVAQRLMRKLCPTCKEVWMETPPERLKRWIPTGTPLYRAAGCPDCVMTGYRGRFSILEILTMNAELERRIAAGDPADRIADAARRAGMKSMWDSGLAHVLRGESTIDELMRVVDVPAEAADIAALAAPAGTPTGSAAHGAHAPGAPPRVAPQPIATHFDLLEEAVPPRRSG